MASNESPRTPEQSKTQPEYDTGHRWAYFWRRDHMKDGEKVSDVAEELGIPDRTGRRWMRERKLMGTPTAKRRVRKNKAASKGSKLGRPWLIPQEVLDEMVGGVYALRSSNLAIL
ncbi:hypothetical protein BU26DRAFT_524387 [Trematosphaeria pertusa]|uniref:Uncharacterized protein n=1 Tax=Trematosphaeria pertusa TaxID=390896 RepID=A0A6A6HX91_9PLEO|nr:uncharacterized protein BU26DRAFT_524387 [Trematosphaeria pertusa]KAF2242825.1 hypothetical protein BU26DRAFT_524387 [Trematosphaeria pertusa]